MITKKVAQTDFRFSLELDSFYAKNHLTVN